MSAFCLRARARAHFWARALSALFQRSEGMSAHVNSLGARAQVLTLVLIFERIFAFVLSQNALKNEHWAHFWAHFAFVLMSTGWAPAKISEKWAQKWAQSEHWAHSFWTKVSALCIRARAREREHWAQVPSRALPTLQSMQEEYLDSQKVHSFYVCRFEYKRNKLLWLVCYIRRKWGWVKMVFFFNVE